MSIGEPPTDLARLQIFVALVDEYDAMTEAFPIPDETNFVISPKGRDPQDRWHRIIRAMALRKFTIGKRDHVHVKRVIDSIRNLTEDNEQWSELISQHRAAWLELQSRIGKGALYNGRDAFDIVTDLVYGIYLHGDYDKWQRIGGAMPLLVEHPLWKFVLDSETLIRHMRDIINAMVTEGIIPRLDGTDPWEAVTDQERMAGE